jgi:cytochrome P450
VAEYQAEVGTQQRKLGDVPHTLDKYVQLKKTHPEMADDVQIVNWLMLSILAGGDTTSATMRAVAYYLAKAPAAYKKLTDELDAANLSIPVSWEAARSLPYLDAVLLEAIRINPGIAMIFERVVPDGGFTLPDGRFIPAGTKVGMNPSVTNRDYTVFGNDADSFNPDRWLKQAGETEEDFEDRRRRMKETSDFTFGAGGRVCMGRNMALLELYKLFATLYSVYDVSGIFLIDTMPLPEQATYESGSNNIAY